MRIQVMHPGYEVIAARQLVDQCIAELCGVGVLRVFGPHYHLDEAPLPRAILDVLVCSLRVADRQGEKAGGAEALEYARPALPEARAGHHRCQTLACARSG